MVTVTLMSLPILCLCVGVRFVVRPFGAWLALWLAMLATLQQAINDDASTRDDVTFDNELDGLGNSLFSDRSYCKIPCPDITGHTQVSKLYQPIATCI